jgi:hypothetical protein
MDGFKKKLYSIHVQRFSPDIIFQQGNLLLGLGQS